MLATSFAPLLKARAAFDRALAQPKDEFTRDASIQRFEMIQPSLHQIFLEKVSRAGPAGEAAAWAHVEEGMSGHG